jgi:hypothetical protein
MDNLFVNIKINEGYSKGIVKLAEVLEKRDSPCVMEIVEEYVNATIMDNVKVTGLHNRRDDHTHRIEVPTYNHNDPHHFYAPHGTSTTCGTTKTSTSSGLSK